MVRFELYRLTYAVEVDLFSIAELMVKSKVAAVQPSHDHVGSYLETLYAENCDSLELNH